MAINKLTAGPKGSTSNSKGADVAAAVNALIDQGGDLQEQIDEAGSATTLIAEHNSSPTAHPELSAFITSEADRAEAASVAASASGSIYQSVASGEAAKADGDYFWVESASDKDVLDLYLMGASNATFTGKSLVSSAFVKSVFDTATINEYSFAISAKDSIGRGRIIFALRSSDGALDDYTLGLLRSRIQEQNPLMEYASVLGHSYVMTMLDSNGDRRMTDLDLRDTDGQFHERVISNIGARLPQYLPYTQRQDRSGNWLHPSGDVLPYRARLNTLIGLGSSSTERSFTDYQAMCSDFGVTYADLGDGGTVLDQHAAMIGARYATINITGGSIPASGSVIATITNIEYSKSVMRPIIGTIAGVHGTLAWDTGILNFRFTRTTGGTAVTVLNGTPLIPDNIDLRSNFLLLEGGKNDITASQGYSAATILSKTQLITEWMAPYERSYVVVGHFADGDFDSSLRTKLADVNSGLLSIYGDLFIDQQAWLTSSEIWDQLSAEGYTPTTQDLADQAAGDVPRGLMIAARDHLTPEAYNWRMKYLIKPKLISLGFYR